MRADNFILKFHCCPAKKAFWKYQQNKMSYSLKMNNLQLMAKACFSFFKFNPRLKPGAINPHNSRALAINLLFYPTLLNKIQIRNENGKGEFRIYDIQGKLMLTEVLTAPNQSTDIRSLKPGIYIWQLKNRRGKLVVQ